MYQILQGGISKDQRGQIRFVNDFNMKDVKRFYIIKNSDLNLIRGWRAHRVEQRWFYVLSGCFSLALVKIDYWDSPSRDLEIKKLKLDSKEHQLINVPSGYGTAFQALEPESELLVFADHYLDHAVLDDYTYEVDYFIKYQYNNGI